MREGGCGRVREEGSFYSVAQAELTALPPSSCIRVAASSVAVTNPVVPRSFPVRARRREAERGVGVRSGGGGRGEGGEGVDWGGGGGGGGERILKGD